MTSGRTMRGKLVRDRIPVIIRRAGLIPVIETASPEDCGRYVRAKLEEELEEYLSSGDAAEVADLVEVCFAAAALHGVGQDELLAIARDKRQQRGGFESNAVAGPALRCNSEMDPGPDPVVPRRGAVSS